MEALAQLGGIVMMDPENKAAQQNFFFGSIEGCKFRKPVVPGDVLARPATNSLHARAQGPGSSGATCCAAAPQMMKVTLTKFNKRFGIAKMDAKAYVGASLCCEAELTLVMGK